MHYFAASRELITMSTARFFMKNNMPKIKYAINIFLFTRKK